MLPSASFHHSEPQYYEESESTKWSCLTRECELKLLSQKEGVEPFVKKAQNREFNYCKTFWCSSVINRNKVLNPEYGYSKDDTIIIEATVWADIPRGVKWYTDHGYVGLENQGVTAYMNSLLQVLYFINGLRRAVYHIPPDLGDSNKSVTLALQRVFHDLQFGCGPVKTKGLMRALGREMLERGSSAHLDVQELLPGLLDKLKNKMTGTSVDGTISELFEGKMMTTIKCKNLNYSSTNIETFFDVQLSIGGKKNIIESFSDYVQPKVLDGENQYDAGEHGPQDAEKTVVFKKLPPVLLVDLRRFLFDSTTRGCVKLQDRFEFTENIDLSDCLQLKKITPQSKYTLLAVVAHCGDVLEYRYVAYINPQCEGQWFKFDEDFVAKCTKQDAIEDNFGGFDGERPNDTDCMLVYVRDDALDILKELTENDIPQANYPVQHIRLWPFVTRNNKTFRPNGIYVDHRTGTVQELFDLAGSTTAFLQLESLKTNDLALTTVTDLALNPYYDFDSEVLLFFKFYNAEDNTIHYCGHRCVPVSYTIAQLTPILNKLAGFPVDTKLLIYEEIEPGLTQCISDVHVPIREAVQELADGDILVFQKVFEITNGGQLPKCADYFRDLHRNVVNMTFCDETVANDSGFTLNLPLSMRFVEMTEAVARHLRVDPLTLKFSIVKINGKEVLIKHLTWESDFILSDFFSKSDTEYTVQVLYHKLTRSPDMENWRSFKVVWKGTEIFLYPRKMMSVADFLEEIGNSPRLSRNGSRKLRLLEMTGGNAPPKCVKEDALVDNVPHDIYLLEEIPEEESNLADNEMLVPVVHCYAGFFSPEIPCFVRIEINEPLSSIKEKVCVKLNIREEFDSGTLTIVHVTRPKQHSIVICHSLKSIL